MTRYFNPTKSDLFTFRSLNVKKYLAIGIMTSLFITACEDEVLPEAGSLADKTPPKAGFNYSADPSDHLIINFSNASISSTTYSWKFGDGGTSTSKNPSHTYSTEGTYTVSLTASDKLNASSSISNDIEILKPPLYEPFILEPSFEDGQLEGGTGDGRDSWRVSGGNRPEGMGGVIQITSGPVRTGKQAAKFPTNNERAGYQEVVVVKDQDYVVKFWYTMKTSPTGSLTISILNGPVSDPANVAGATIANKTVSDQSDANTYIEESIEFNSGDSDLIVIYFTNTDVETRVEDVSIDNK